MAQKSEEAEYIALSFAIKEALWLPKFCKPRGLNNKPIPIAEDNEGYLQLPHENVLNERIKHKYVKYQIVMDNVKEHRIEPYAITDGENVANPMTTSMANVSFLLFHNVLGVVAPPECSKSGGMS